MRQYRYAHGVVMTEIPAGKLDSADEDHCKAALRELREETGCESDEWTHLLTVPSNATIADNYAYIYAAKNCRRVTGPNLDAMEFLNVERYPAQEIDKMIAEGKFQQAMHITGWLLYNKYLESDRQDSGGR